MSKVYIKRNWHYIGMVAKFYVRIDGVEHPETLATNQTIMIEVTPGNHELGIKQRMNPTARVPFTIQEGEEVHFETGVSRMLFVFLGMVMSSLIFMNLGQVGLFIGILISIIGLIGMLIYMYAMKKEYYIKEVRRVQH